MHAASFLNMGDLEPIGQPFRPGSPVSSAHARRLPFASRGLQAAGRMTETFRKSFSTRSYAPSWGANRLLAAAAMIGKCSDAPIKSGGEPCKIVEHGRDQRLPARILRCRRGGKAVEEITRLSTFLVRLMNSKFLQAQAAN
jgi:hypothetical protein